MGVATSSDSCASGKDETEFFEQNCPIPQEDALRAMAMLYHEVLPAFKTSDLTGLCKGLEQVQSTGFKALEVDRLGLGTKALIEAFAGSGFASGLSSMGPLVYAIMENVEESISRFRDICQKHGASCLGVYRGLNRAADVEVVECK